MIWMLLGQDNRELNNGTLFSEYIASVLDSKDWECCTLCSSSFTLSTPERFFFFLLGFRVIATYVIAQEERQNRN